MSVSKERVLQLALEHLDEKRQEIDAEIVQIKTTLANLGVKRRGRPAAAGSDTSGMYDVPTMRGKGRQMSAAQKRRISEKMKQRWAERKRAAVTKD